MGFELQDISGRSGRPPKTLGILVYITVKLVLLHRTEEPLPVCTAKEEEAALQPSLTELQTENNGPENRNHSKSWRLDAARDPERYLHRTLH